MPQTLFQALAHTLQTGQPVALATVIATKGSLPMSRRAKMLLFADGSITGTVGGGALEATVMQRAVHTLQTETPEIVSVDLTSDQIEAEGLTCGGTVEILLEPFTPRTDTAVIEELARLEEQAQNTVIATLLTPGRAVVKIIAREDGTVVGTSGAPTVDPKILHAAQSKIGQDALEIVEIALTSAEAAYFGFSVETPLRVFLESVLPPPTAYLFGGGHVSRAIAGLLPALGFEYVVIDDRADFLTPARFPAARTFLCERFEKACETPTLPPYTSYVLILTRGHQFDFQILQQALRWQVKYLGMLGSRRKITLFFEQLRAQGFDQQALDRIHAPIGIAIGADTPAEIAISVAAELIRVRRGTV